MIAQDFTMVPNDLADSRAIVFSPGFWRPRIWLVDAPRWMPARSPDPPCLSSCHPCWGYHPARPPRCHPLYFRSRSDYPCRAAHCSLWIEREEKYKKRAFSYNIRLICSRKSGTSLLLATFFLWPAGSLEKCV